MPLKGGEEMARSILIDEFHLSVYGPRGLPEAEYEDMRRMFDDPAWQAELRHAVRAVFRSRPELRKVKVTLTR
jgi:hypothetical protein